MTLDTVHIVDDDAAIGRALTLLASSAGYTAVAHISVEAFLEAFDEASTGCVVSDVRMPGMSGLDLHRALKDRGASTPVILITGHGAVSMAVEALKGGVADFIEKPFDDDVFLSAVGAALTLSRKAAETKHVREDLTERASHLSPREREVMDMIVTGLSGPEVAKVLGISIRTVESHRARAMEKMEAGSLAELVRMSIVLTGGPPLTA